MTNKQAAEHFASLPPEENAKILLVNADTEFVETETLNEPSNTTIEGYEGAKDEHKTLPQILLKW